VTIEGDNQKQADFLASALAKVDPARMQGRRLVYESGEWEIDLARRELRARGAPVPIGSRAFDIIEVLVRSAGELITKHDLASRVWPGAIVEDNALQFHISAIRKALGPDRELLRTASGRGYRLLGDWTFQQESTSPAGSIDLEPVQIGHWLLLEVGAGERAERRWG
jgi:DNA-binding winged helix-turn-helix (wHTH) protein